MTEYDAATEGETGRRPDRRGAIRGRRRLPSGTRSRRFRRGLEQPVGAGDQGPARVRLLRAARRERRLPAVRTRPRTSTRARTDLGLVEHVASNDDIAVVLDRYEAQLSGRSGRSSRRSRCRPARRRLPVPGLLGREDASPSAWARRQEGRPLVGDPSAASTEARGRPPIRHLFLENVDRLLKSPTGQRGRDFAVMLASLADLGYEVEWRVVNAADYGFPQKRRRVFIIGRLGRRDDSPQDQLLTIGRPGRALPARARGTFDWAPIALDRDIKVVSDDVRPRRATRRRSGTPASCGSRPDGRGAGVWTDGRRARLRTVDARSSRTSSKPTRTCRSSSSSTTRTSAKWQFLKGAKSLTRISRSTGLEYTYDEGRSRSPTRSTGRRGPS